MIHSDLNYNTFLKIIDVTNVLSILSCCKDLSEKNFKVEYINDS